MKNELEARIIGLKDEYQQALEDIEEAYKESYIQRNQDRYFGAIQYIRKVIKDLEELLK